MDNIIDNTTKKYNSKKINIEQKINNNIDDLNNIDNNKNKEQDKKYKCDKCNFSSNLPSAWFRHVETPKHKSNMSNEEKPKKEFYCECCNHTCYNSTYWKVHINSQRHKRGGQSKSKECVQCNRKFTNHLTQHHHMLSAHSTKEERSKEKFYCEICDFVFVLKLNLDKHNKGQNHLSKVKALEILREINKATK